MRVLGRRRLWRRCRRHARYVRTAVLDGKLYAAGGVSVADNLATSNLVERYDLAAKLWEAVAPMAVEQFAPAAAVLDDDKLYAVGGYTTTTASSARWSGTIRRWMRGRRWRRWGRSGTGSL